MHTFYLSNIPNLIVYHKGVINTLILLFSRPFCNTKEIRMESFFLAHFESVLWKVIFDKVFNKYCVSVVSVFDGDLHYVLIGLCAAHVGELNHHIDHILMTHCCYEQFHCANSDQCSFFEKCYIGLARDLHKVCILSFCQTFCLAKHIRIASCFYAQFERALLTIVTLVLFAFLWTHSMCLVKLQCWEAE
jgi:hypothetical protein